MKDTLKTLTLLEEHLVRLTEQGIYEIERDLILERLRQLYSIVATSELLPDSLIDEPVMYGCPPVEYEPIAEEETEESEVVPEIEEEVAEEPLAEEVAPEIEEDVAEEEETMTEEPVVVAEPQEVADEELDHEVVMSLYDDDEEEEEPVVVEEEEVKEEEPEATEFEEMPAEEELPEFEEVPAEPETPAEEELPEFEEVPAVAEAPQSVVLGDILGTEQITVADNLAEQVIDVATATTANLSLRQTIAINDKFILMRDLFGGNNDYYEMAIDRLDSFDNLDDAMLYIYDNFHWNPNCEGARLLMELLARKLI